MPACTKDMLILLEERSDVSRNLVLNKHRFLDSVVALLLLRSKFNALSMPGIPLMRYLLVTLPLFTGIGTSAQLIDDFSDGDITNDPVWIGDIDHFIVTPEQMLRLDAPAAGTSAILTSIALGDSAEWRFFYRMDFAPSATNKLRIYLMLDTEDITNAKGYFIEIGENGSSDAMRFSRLDNGTISPQGASDGIFGGDPSTARIRITRNDGGMWTFYGDLSGGQNYQQLFTLTDAAHALSTGEFFGIECTYTETRRTLFYFDDILVGLPEPDTEPASILSVVVDDETHLTVEFSEELDQNTGVDPDNYFIQPDIGNPANVSFPDGMHRSVDLVLSTPLQSNVPYTLQVSGVTDLSGNVTNASGDFTFIKVAQPDPYDVLINEIMADPSPPLGQPNAEYLELYNRGTEAFQLENYGLTVGSLTALLPEYILDEGSYVLIVDDGDASLFASIPNKIIVNLPALTNSGTTLELTDALGTLLHRLSYDLTSYQDAARDDGGWSLELINPEAPCTLTNLRASLDLTGGTPGKQNSVTTNTAPDDTGPKLLRIFPASPTQLQCEFDEVISDGQVSISLEPEHSVIAMTAEDNLLEITLQTPLQAGALYTVRIDQVADCLGNTSTGLTSTFALPQPAEAGDMLINEIVFDPGTGGSRFIEVINVSNKYLDVGELIVADIQGDTVAVSPVETSFLLFPGTIAAITPNPLDIAMRYFMHDPGRLVSNTLPSFSRTAGNATIYTRSGVVLDAFDYSEDFHNALIDDAQGVSLERISPNLPTQSKETWHSAAQTAGFATPGLPNSQRLPDITGEGILEIEPEVFSPDGDGTDDFVSIAFPGAQPSVLATVRIFDAHGRNIASVAENTSIGTGTVLRWDGIDDSGARARIGIYIIWIELFDADGNTDNYKRTCVLAERL